MRRIHPRWRIPVAAGTGLLVAAAIGWAAWVIGPGAASSGTAAPDFGTAPTYTLTDQQGRRFDSAQLRGHVQVVSFLFPYCTSFCPLLASSLVQAQAMLDADGLSGQVEYVAFNVDPDNAGPGTLAAFLRQEGIDPADPAWHFLTGLPDQVRTVVRDGFHVFYQKVSIADEQRTEDEQKAAGTFTPQPTAPNSLAASAGVDYDMIHNDVVEIVDGQGVIRAVIADDSVPAPSDIVAAVRAALPSSSA